MYDLPEEIDVCADGPLRIITLNRPEALNAVNDALHTGLARLWPRLSEDRAARAAVLTGSGTAFSAGGDFAYLEELGRDPELRARTIAHGRDLVLGMAAADGGPLTWPLHTSLHLAKEYALTGARIPAARAVQFGLANHLAADPLAEARQCAERIAGLPRQAVESTKRLLNVHLERAVLATLDFATTAEDQSFQTDDFRTTIAKLNTPKT